MAFPSFTSNLILSKRHVQHSHLTSSCQKGPALTSDLIFLERLYTYIWPHLVRKDLHLHMISYFQKGSTLTSNLILSERLYTYIWSCGNTSHNHIRMALHLYLIMWEHIPQSHQNGSALIFDHVGMHPTITLEWLCTDNVGTHPRITSEYLCTYIWPCEA